MMSEQVARHEALLLADEPRLQAILPQGAVVCGDKPVSVVLAADYDALHAEAEALRAENGRLSEELDKTELRALKFIHQCNAHVDLYRELKAERDQLSTELEAIKGQEVGGGN